MRPVPTPRTQPISRGIWAVITTLLMSVPAIAGANPITAYQSGEKLTYDVKVMGSPAGTGTLQVGKARKVRGKKVTPIIGEVKSANVFHNVYPVDDRILSLVNSQLVPVRTEMKIREKTLKRDLLIQYDPKRKRATGQKSKNGRTRDFDRRVPANTQDMLSWLYKIRTLDYENGDTFAMTGFSGNFVYDIRMKRKEKTTIFTSLGNKEAWPLEVTVTRRGGRKRFKKEAMIWMGTDANRTPLRLEVELKVGDVRVDLASIHRPGAPKAKVTAKQTLPSLPFSWQTP